MNKLVLALALFLATPAFAEDVVESRIANFKQSGKDIQAVFKKHIPADDYAAIIAAAERMTAWAEKIPVHFPAGSTSKGAKTEIWENFSDFEAKAARNAWAARTLAQAARAQDNKQVVARAKLLGSTCKACHDDYRNKK